MQWRKDSGFNKSCWINWISTSKKRKNEHIDNTPFIKINSKLITDLNLKHTIIKLPEDSIEENPDVLAFANIFR